MARDEVLHRFTLALGVGNRLCTATDTRGRAQDRADLAVRV